VRPHEMISFAVFFYSRREDTGEICLRFSFAPVVLTQAESLLPRLGRDNQEKFKPPRLPLYVANGLFLGRPRNRRVDEKLTNLRRCYSISNTKGMTITKRGFIALSSYRRVVACGFRKREGGQDQETARPKTGAVVHATIE
jgi:hypothetical protein